MSIETFEKLPEEKKELIVSTGIREFASRSYREASTDEITRASGISKGILFHYFGSKKNFYLYCLETALRRLTADDARQSGDSGDFYGIIFGEMKRKISLCRDRMDETLMVNMASRDPSGEISEERDGLVMKYTADVRRRSLATVTRAVSALPLKEPGKKELVTEGVYLYVSAVVNRYLSIYRQDPGGFFENADSVEKQIKEYLGLMLEGVCSEREEK